MFEKQILDMFIDNCLGCKRKALFFESLNTEDVIIYCEIHSCEYSKEINESELPLQYVERAFGE